jgi:hypothetical protein
VPERGSTVRQRASHKRRGLSQAYDREGERESSARGREGIVRRPRRHALLYVGEPPERAEVPAGGLARVDPGEILDSAVWRGGATSSPDPARMDTALDGYGAARSCVM